jgi:hypothetical protein
MVYILGWRRTMTSAGPPLSSTWDLYPTTYHAKGRGIAKDTVHGLWKDTKWCRRDYSVRERICSLAWCAT